MENLKNQTLSDQLKRNIIIDYLTGEQVMKDAIIYSLSGLNQNSFIEYLLKLARAFDQEPAQTMCDLLNGWVAEDQAKQG